MAAMIEQKYRTCNLCEAMCGMVITLDDGAITELCLKTQPADDLIRAVILRVFSRPATCDPMMKNVAVAPLTLSTCMISSV